LQVRATMQREVTRLVHDVQRSGRGDMYVLVTVATPTNLSNDQKKLLKDLAKSLPSEALPQEHGLIDRVHEVDPGS